jgi:HPt (histidine-containing phosphotransfer) domain-containing protein
VKPIRSIYENDPDMIDIVREFAEELPDRVRSIETMWESRNRDGLQTLAHQLKGAGGGYGFPEITHRAADLEAALKTDIDDCEIVKRMHALCEILRAVQVSEAS